MNQKDQQQLLGLLDQNEAMVFLSRKEPSIYDLTNRTESIEVEDIWEEGKKAYKRKLEPFEWISYSIGKNLFTGLELVGVNKKYYPPEGIQFLIANNIVQKFGSLTMNDIVRSFNCAIDELTGVEYRVFDQPVGWGYIRRILSGYREFKGKMNLRIQNKLKSFQKPEYNAQIDEFIQTRIKNSLSLQTNLEFVHNYIFDNRPVELNQIVVSSYYLLEDLGHLGFVSNEVKDNCKTFAKGIVKQKFISIQGESQNTLIDEYYKRGIVLHWFNEIREAGVDKKAFNEIICSACYINPETHEQLHKLKQKSQSQHEIRGRSEGELQRHGVNSD